jgi:hypothetical protein
MCPTYPSNIALLLTQAVIKIRSAAFSSSFFPKIKNQTVAVILASVCEKIGRSVAYHEMV